MGKESTKLEVKFIGHYWHIVSVELKFYGSKKVIIFICFILKKARQPSNVTTAYCSIYIHRSVRNFTYLSDWSLHINFNQNGVKTGTCVNGAPFINQLLFYTGTHPGYHATYRKLMGLEN